MFIFLFILSKVNLKLKINKIIEYIKNLDMKVLVVLYNNKL